MDDLIKALQIFRKYGNPVNPVHAEHDELYVCGYEEDTITDPADVAALKALGFNWYDGDGAWMMFT